MRLPVAVQVLLLWCVLGAWVYLAMGRETSQAIEAPPAPASAGPRATAHAPTGIAAVPPPTALLSAAGRPAHLGPHDCYYSRLYASAELSREEVVAMLTVAEPPAEGLVDQECGVWPPPPPPPPPP